MRKELEGNADSLDDACFFESSLKTAEVQSWRQLYRLRLQEKRWARGAALKTRALIEADAMAKMKEKKEDCERRSV